MFAHLIALKNSLTHNIVIKMVSFIIGYSLWLSFSQSHTIAIWLKVPVCFYGTEKKIEAPEQIAIHLAGKRSKLATIDTNNLTAHINTDNLHEGPNPLVVQASDLFLPNSITVLDCLPSNSIITVTNSIEIPHEEINKTVS